MADHKIETRPILFKAVSLDVRPFFFSREEIA